MTIEMRHRPEQSTSFERAGVLAIRYRWLAWLLCVPILWSAAEWVMDRDPPFALLGAASSTPAQPGEATIITGTVKRDLTRSCGAQWTHAFFDASWRRHDYGEGAYFTALELRNQAITMGVDRLNSAVIIPRAAEPGRGLMVMSLAYDCNPVHWVWPIRVTVSVAVQVLPP